ncbi:MAG: Grx4 family monothiol glutaredoxin [Myxococcota bacterium]
MAKTDLNESLRTRIDALVSAKDTVLFMKGQKMSPQCGFSARVVHILNTLGADYNDVNILEDPELREGMKVYSDWPTFPQLYYKGELVGGCDIVTDLAQKGELQKMMGK